jgi:hypothetical protein
LNNAPRKKNYNKKQENNKAGAKCKKYKELATKKKRKKDPNNICNNDKIDKKAKLSIKNENKNN